MRHIVLLFLGFVLSLPALTRAEHVDIPIANFHLVSPGVFRGGRPEEVGVKALAQLGVKTILNLDNDTNAVRIESEIAKSIHIKMISMPMSSFWAPKDKQVDQILSALNDAERPVFVHCKYGQDRTGLIVGLYRVEHQEWSPEQAYTEMLELGFHQSLIFLDNYFKKRISFDD